jgi:hypothetical protein
VASHLPRHRASPFKEPDVHHHLSRREFTLDAVLAILSGVVITLTTTGCGSTTPASPSASPSPTPSPTSGDVTGVVSANHGHVAVVTQAQMTAGGAVTLNIQGQATHNHTVQLSQAEIAQIAARQRVSKDSSTEEFHQHTVTFN